MPGVLEGIRVIDFGQYIAGPLAAVMLGDQGADVIHVDPPGGPRWQHPSDAFFNRGKRRIILDLKTPDGLDAAKRLIDGADVVIENFRPGVMERLGLGAEAMTAADPRLIYCLAARLRRGRPARRHARLGGRHRRRDRQLPSRARASRRRIGTHSALLTRP